MGRHRIEPVRFIDAGERVVVIQHEYQRGKGSGVEIEIDTASVFEFRGGRILRIQPYMNPAQPSKPWGCRSCSPPTGLRRTNTPCTGQTECWGRSRPARPARRRSPAPVPAARSPAGPPRIVPVTTASKVVVAEHVAPPRRRVAAQGTVSLCSKATTVPASFAGPPSLSVTRTTPGHPQHAV